MAITYYMGYGWWIYYLNLIIVYYLYYFYLNLFIIFGRILGLNKPVKPGFFTAHKPGFTGLKTGGLPGFSGTRVAFPTSDRGWNVKF